ncbi:MAG: hypothetical protein H0T42_07220 [Deltaproteobacteria bacterium]|nr:hypothetical protein [Deltaproteobacteria bacterium]
MKCWVLALLTMTACTTKDPGPDTAELAALDEWTAAADGKSDLPTSWSDLVRWLRNIYANDMSAIWENQEHPPTASKALERIRGLVVQGGVDPARARFRVTVQRLDAGDIDHSEIDIALPAGQVIRLVGDPKGGGAFVDDALFEETVGPRLCLTWAELETAVTASYVTGTYGVNFVCHNVTERVLRSLGIGTAPYARLFRTYSAARWIWGPPTPTFNSHNPASWPQSRSCD